MALPWLDQLKLGENEWNLLGYRNILLIRVTKYSQEKESCISIWSDKMKLTRLGLSAVSCN